MELCQGIPAEDLVQYLCLKSKHFKKANSNKIKKIWFNVLAAGGKHKFAFHIIMNGGSLSSGNVTVQLLPFEMPKLNEVG